MPYEQLLENGRYFRRLKGMKVREALEKKGYKAVYVDTGREAFNLVLDLVPPGTRVGVGGSVTIRQLGLLEALRERGHEVYDHWDPSLTREQEEQARRAHLTCDVFLTSTNAITKDGTLINIDFSGNRVAAMIFGPRRTVIVAGINKIVEDVDAGIKRVRNVVSPPTFRRRKMDHPCTEAGFCIDCRRPDRPCRVITILEARPAANPDFHVILVGEELGY
ncbi:MAG: hypothetical protein PWP65_1781 [Clostridia bacterium]|nr:hypothetical protein [Clostridia bacterium]